MRLKSGATTPRFKSRYALANRMGLARMRSGICAILVLILAAFAVVSCVLTRPQQGSGRDGNRDADEVVEARERALAIAQESLGKVDDYEVGVATFQQFRQYQWPSFTLLHMDVRPGPIETADALVVLGIAGGEAIAGGGTESLVAAALEQSDGRGLCIVRGWLDGQRHVAALPIECPEQVRDELDDILDEFDDLTGGDAVWVLAFEEGVLRRKERL